MNSDFILYILVLSIFNTAFSAVFPILGLCDELLVVAILFCTYNRHDFVKSREVKFCIGIFVFYLIYSLFMAINVKNATIRDFLICTKPFVCFYTAQYYGMNFSEVALKKCRNIILFLGVSLWFMSPFISKIYYNTAFFYPACAYTGILYLLLSDYNKKDWIIATMILLPGLLSIRAKFFAEFVLWLFIAFFMKKRIKFNISFLLICPFLIYIIYKINYDKIMLYTVNGVEDGAARTYLYITSLDVFKDFFPLGPGFGTFATDSAAKYYSPLNYYYGLNNIWGLNPDDTIGTSFYSDTFYPLLAQFGIIGAILFFLFIKKRWQEGSSIENDQKYKLFIFCVAYILIQCIAENSFTGANGVPIMLILGLSLSSSNRNSNYWYI